MSVIPFPSAPPKTKTGLSRRRTLRILAAAAGLPLAIGGLRALAPGARYHSWTGEALGAQSSLHIWSPDGSAAERMIARTRVEIARIERIFSLSRSDSEIAALNRTGAIERPSADMVELVNTAQALGTRSGGAYDVTVQPLWRLYESLFWGPGEDRDNIEGRALEVARAVVDYRNIEAGRRRIAFARPDMSITLNSIAQGYLTDRVADMLRTEGFEHVYVDLGEIRALGANPEGKPWHIGIRDAREAAAIERTIDVVDQAISVSGGYGTVFEPTGRYHHIFDPATGLSAARMVDVTVIAPRARDADGLSTAIYVAGEDRAAELLAGYPGSRAIITRLDGSSVTLTAAGPVEA